MTAAPPEALVEVVALSANPLDDSNGLNLSNLSDTTDFDFSAITWTEARKTAESVSTFGVVRVMGAAGYVKKISDSSTVISSINSGDYLAYDSYLVWLIESPNWAAQDVVTDGAIGTVNIL